MIVNSRKGRQEDAIAQTGSLARFLRRRGLGWEDALRAKIVVDGTVSRVRRLRRQSSIDCYSDLLAYLIKVNLVSSQNNNIVLGYLFKYLINSCGNNNEK